MTEDQSKENAQNREQMERQALGSRMGKIGKKLLVLSGKGGVGKSTVAVNLAASLAMAGKRVGLLDIDIHGPSVPKLLNIQDAGVEGTENSLFPVKVHERLGVMSIGLLLRNRDDAVIWRGPMKYNAIKQFLMDVEWGDLDYLIVDSPPGTGDEPLSVVQLIENPDGAVIVTTPQELAVQDVRKSIMFCRQLKLPVSGVIENMSGFTCPHCNKRVDIFGTGGGEEMAKKMGVPFLGSVPIDTQVVDSGEEGKPFVMAHDHSETSMAFGKITKALIQEDIDLGQAQIEEKQEGGEKMKIAVPVANGMLSLHFGHCQQFAVFDVDSDSQKILGKQMLDPPGHEPGVLPKWLHEQGADVILTGGMGARAQNLFTQSGIKVVVGAPANDPEEVVKQFLAGDLQPGQNICDH